MKKRQDKPRERTDLDSGSSHASPASILAQNTPETMLPNKETSRSKSHTKGGWTAIAKDVSTAGASRTAKNSGQLVLGGAGGGGGCWGA